jgi:dTDP-4-dehydrorhamnose reductase
MTEGAALRWLILGSGFVGSALAAHLETAGDLVRSMAAPRLEADVDSDDATLAEQAANHPALEGLTGGMAHVDCVVLAAGLATPDATPTPALVGANALLPGVVLRAAQSAGVRRYIHLSSAAVQGRRRVLTEAAETDPFSAYSASKAIGERVVRRSVNDSTNAVIVRATSVQGPGRRTTAALRRIARSRLSTVARPGSQPSALSSICRLCDFVEIIGRWLEAVPLIVLQPWEGLSVCEALAAAGDRDPRRLPAWMCRAATEGGFLASTLLGHRLDGTVRRAEAMWFGQSVEAGWAGSVGLADRFADGEQLRMVLAGD